MLVNLYHFITPSETNLFPYNTMFELYTHILHIMWQPALLSAIL